ncbi:MAG TPA: PH domain-containing protein [Flavobacterium sp.]|nr:PH domain-containing protein [Flavobacterium sp.]
MQEFSNTIIDLQRLPKYQEVVFEKLHPKYKNVIVINLSIISMIILFATMSTFISVYFSADKVARSFYIGILGAALVFIVLLFWLSFIAFKKKGYALREKDLLYRRGILATSKTIIPFNRIQHIAVSEGVFSRFYGLASIEIYTAGGSSSDLRIAGIEKERAYQIKEFLMKNLNGEPKQTPIIASENHTPQNQQDGAAEF